MKMVGEILSKLRNLGPSYYSMPKGTCFCFDLSCKNMMVSFSCLFSFSSLISKLEPLLLEISAIFSSFEIKLLKCIELILFNPVLFQTNRLKVTVISHQFSRVLISNRKSAKRMLLCQ